MRLRFAMRALLAVLVGYIPPTWAADFSGTWVLDLGASDSIGPLLEAQGVGYLKRKIAGSMVVTHTITQEGDVVTIATDSALKSATTVLRVDGEIREVQGDRHPQRVRHYWQGDELVTSSILTMPDGQATLTAHRCLSEDGQTFIQRIAFLAPDGTRIEADRVFKRQR